MHFFTADDYRSIDNDGKRFAAQLAAYKRHLEGLRGLLPDEVLALAVLPGVDDGLLIEVHHDRALRTLQLILRCGDLQMGYYDLRLDYEEIDLPSQTAWTLARIARTTTSDGRHQHDVAYHEIDRSEDGGIDHRLLFHPGVVVTLRCRSLHWRTIAQPDRNFPALPDRFPGGPAWAAYHARRRRLRAEPPRR